MRTLPLILVLAAPGWAADVPGTDKQAARLAEEFGITPEQVKELRAKGMGWGEVRHALSLSKQSGKPVEEIIKQRESGMGWGEIAQREGASLGEGRGKNREARPERRERPERGAGREGKGGGPKK